MFRILSVFLVCLAAITNVAFAQQGGRITGVVRDAQFRPLTGVEISLVTHSRRQTTFTNDSGEFAFNGVSDGRTILVPRLNGYGATRRYEVDVRSAGTHQVEMVLYLRFGNPPGAFDPDFNRIVDFAEPRGYSLALLLNRSTSTLAIGGEEAAGSATAVRAEFALEFDRNWMFGVRGGASFGETSRDVNFRYNASNTFTYRDYTTQRLDALVRYSPLRNTRRARPFVSASFGISKFDGEVRVTNLEAPAQTSGNGLVITVGGGLQVSVVRNFAFDAGVEWSGTSFEQWRINSGVIGLPNLRVYGTDFVIAGRWWPKAR